MIYGGEGQDEFALLDENAAKMPDGKPFVFACTPCQRLPLSQTPDDEAD